MPQTTIVFYKEEDGQVPVLAWLRALQRRDRRAVAACRQDCAMRVPRSGQGRVRWGAAA